MQKVLRLRRSMADYLFYLIQRDLKMKSLFIALALMVSSGLLLSPGVYARTDSTEVILMDYRVQPGDTLAISVWGEEEMKRDILVRPDGGITFPLAGDISVVGKSVAQIRAELTSRLSRYIPSPAVDVSILKTEGNRFFVLGQVKSPGEFPLSSNTDVLQAISMAGGLTPFAKTRAIKILRREGASAEQVVIPFDYKRVIRDGQLEMNVLLRSGDTIIVP